MGGKFTHSLLLPGYATDYIEILIDVLGQLVEFFWMNMRHDHIKCKFIAWKIHDLGHLETEVHSDLMFKIFSHGFSFYRFYLNPHNLKVLEWKWKQNRASYSLVFLWFCFANILIIQWNFLFNNQPHRKTRKCNNKKYYYHLYLTGKYSQKRLIEKKKKIFHYFTLFDLHLHLHFHFVYSSIRTHAGSMWDLI